VDFLFIIFKKFQAATLPLKLVNSVKWVKGFTPLATMRVETQLDNTARGAGGGGGIKTVAWTAELQKDSETGNSVKEELENSISEFPVSP
jgi:hypothetical protein